MNKIMISLVALATLTTASNASWIGALAPDKQIGNISLSVGQATIGEETNPLYTLDLGGNYYYDNGIMWGSTIGIGYTKNPDTAVDNNTMIELGGKFKLGYSFGETAKGFGIYGIADFSYLAYNRTTTNVNTAKEEDEFANANGIGFGGGAEYRFDNDLLITATYTTTQMTPDYGSKFDYDKALVGIGYSW
jgi:hypothetical protein